MAFSRVLTAYDWNNKQKECQSAVDRFLGTCLRLWNQWWAVWMSIRFLLQIADEPKNKSRSWMFQRFVDEFVWAIKDWCKIRTKERAIEKKRNRRRALIPYFHVLIFKPVLSLRLVSQRMWIYKKIPGNKLTKKRI